MPNIENLKKQAKQYLRWHRERYYPVAADIRAALPQFSHLGDEDILRATFRLADAQELVARHAGFDGWQALISGADAMKGRPKKSATRPILNSTEAQLYVSDVKASCAFYTAKLGFEISFVYGDPPFYGQVHRFLEFQASDVRFSQTLKREPWGARTFIINDPDGNLVLFAGPAE